MKKTSIFPWAVLLATWYLAGCYTFPVQALASTVPLDPETRAIDYLGWVEGEACNRNLLFLVPIATDGSVYAAKGAAMAAVKSKQVPVGLVNVSVDVESLYLLIYNHHCTIVRGVAFAYADPPGKAQTGPSEKAPGAAPASTPRPSSRPAMMEDLESKRSAILACLSGAYIESDVTITIHVGGDGAFRSAEAQESIPSATQACISDVLKTVSYAPAEKDYVLEYRYGQQD